MPATVSASLVWSASFHLLKLACNNRNTKSSQKTGYHQRKAESKDHVHRWNRRTHPGKLDIDGRRILRHARNLSSHAACANDTSSLLHSWTHAKIPTTISCAPLQMYTCRGEVPLPQNCTECHHPWHRGEKWARDIVHHVHVGVAFQGTGTNGRQPACKGLGSPNLTQECRCRGKGAEEDNFAQHGLKTGCVVLTTAGTSVFMTSKTFRGPTRVQIPTCVQIRIVQRTTF